MPPLVCRSQGFGTDDNALTDILCNRSKGQNARINEEYKKKYGQLLVDQVFFQVFMVNIFHIHLLTEKLMVF